MLEIPWWSVLPALAAGAAGAMALGRRRGQVLARQVRRLERVAARRGCELERAREELERLATHDELTGLTSQRVFWEHARRAAATAGRYRTGLAFIVVDVDRMKELNDLHGHAAGDEVLRLLAHRLGQVTRSSDVLARYGGDQFVVLLGQTDAEAARRAAERMHEHLSNAAYLVDGTGEIAVTTSFGVAMWAGPDDDLEELFTRADAAVREAKRTRDAVAVFSGAESPQPVV